MDIRKLEQGRAALQAEAKGIIESAVSAGRPITAEEAKRGDEIAEAITRYDSTIAMAKAARDAAPAIETVVHATAEAPNHTKDPRRGFSSHREFLGAVMAGRFEDERIKPLLTSDSEDKQARGQVAVLLPTAFTPPSVLRATAGSDEQGTYDDRYGGFLVGKEKKPGILSIGFEGDPTVGLTQAVPMGKPVVEFDARVDKSHATSVSGGFTVGRKAETVAASASRMQFEQVTLRASSLFGLAYATEEILTDSPESFVAIVDQGFRTQFGAHLLNEKLRGTGAGEFLGILTALAASSLGPTISIAKEGGQVADTIDSQNVIKMAARCWGFGSSVWLANHDCRPQLMTLSIKVGTAGQLIYQPSAQMGFPDMLLGRPIYYTEYASTVGDVGDIILANFSQYLEGVYQPLQSAESVHVRFLNHERAFKFWVRNAGAPWWKSALTPAKSSNTLSPFVVLAERA